MFIVGVVAGIAISGLAAKFFVKKNDEMNGEGTSEKVFNQMKDKVVENIKNKMGI